MTDVQRELNDPAVLRVLLDIPTMQRWEILRRTQRALSAAELAAESKATAEESQQSLDRLAEARLVHVNRMRAQRRQITYRAAMDRLFLVWDRSKPEDVEAQRAVDTCMRDYSRRIQDEAMTLVRTGGLKPKNVGGAISVVLHEDDSMKVREAFRALYELLVEADQRARSGSDPARCTPYHVAFSQTRLREPQSPMAELFVIDKESVRRDPTVFMEAPSKVLSPREFQVAKLLEAGRSRPAIAAELGLTANTVSSLSKIIYRKLGVRSRAELAVRMR
jgi:DNA-binding CsgD family transcriptional regulator